jgi:hypothetical protein
MPSKTTYWRRRVVVLSAFVVVAWVGARVAPALAPPAVTPFQRLFVDSKQPEVVVTTTSETDRRISVLGLRCPDVAEAAYSLGWHFNDLDELDYIVWRESRCLPEVHYSADPNDGSHGLMQINGYWCQPSPYDERGWLQGQGAVGSCQDLYNPIVNLLAGLAIFNYSAANNGNGWQPWGMDKDFCSSSTYACVVPVIVGG